MPRYIFPAGAVTVTDGRPRALQFFRSPTATRPQTDLKRVESEYDTTPIANGVITTDESGNYPEFAGPDDLTALWLQVSGSSERTKLSTTKPCKFSEPPKQAGTYLTIGQTQVNVDAYDGDLSAAMADNGPGKKYWLTNQNYSKDGGDIVLGAGTILEGAGSGVTTLTLVGSSRVVTDQFDRLTGTNNNTDHGPSQFALRHLTIEGGNGVKVFGCAYEVDDVTVRGTSGVGFYSEWTNNDNPIPPEASMETRIKGLKTHHCGSTGFHFNGPHDSVLDSVHSFFNYSGPGMILGTKANGVHLDKGHVYGVEHAFGLQMLGSGQIVTSTQVEGANGPQLEIRKAGSKFEGRIFSAQGNENVKGIIIGASGDLGASIRVDAVVENCWAGALDVTYDGGGSNYDIICNSAAGKPVIVGNMPANSTANINLLGGVTYNGWNEPWTVGKSHYTDTIDTLGGLVASYGTFRVETIGDGSTMSLTKLTTGTPANPNAQVWKLYLVAGTTADTAKLVARGSAGTVTTILDNIPA